MLLKLVFPSRRSLDSKEVCRFQLDANTKCKTIHGLMDKIREITGLKKMIPFKLYHNKEGRFKPITTDVQLDQMYNSCSDSKEIYIYAIPSPRDDGKPLNSFFSYYAASDLPDIVSTPNTKLESLVKDPWMTAPCKLCERPDWTGDRYTCLYCPMLTLCHQCFHTGYHPKHPILVTKDTKTFSRKLMQLARVVVATVPWEPTGPAPQLKPAEAEPAPKPALPPRGNRAPKRWP